MLPKLTRMGCLTCCSLTAQNTYFRKEWSYVVTLGRPAVVSIPIPLENVSSLTAQKNNFTFVAARIY
jgi:hypothetical protein